MVAGGPIVKGLGEFKELVSRAIGIHHGAHVLRPLEQIKADKPVFIDFCMP